MAKLKNFYKKHKPLVIGVVVYILVYFITIAADYWMFEKQWGWVADMYAYYSENSKRLFIEQMTEGFASAYFDDVLPDNSIAALFPLSFFYYGILEIARAVHEGVLLGFAMFTYGYLVSKAVEKRAVESYKTVSKFECIVVRYLYSNAVTALCCTIALVFDRTIMKGFNNLYDTNNNSTFMLLIAVLLVVPIVVFVFVPAIPNWLYFFLYNIAFKPVAGLINLLGEKVFGSIPVTFLGELASFITAVIILFVFNVLLMDRLLEKIQWLVSRPLMWFIGLIKKPFAKRRKKQTEKEKISVSDLDV